MRNRVNLRMSKFTSHYNESQQNQRSFSCYYNMLFFYIVRHSQVLLSITSCSLSQRLPQLRPHVQYKCIFHLSVFHRVLDIEPDSEDEDAILERRRQLRRAIEEKYQTLKPTDTAASSPAKSEASADSDLVGLQAAE